MYLAWVQKATLEKAAKGEIERPSERRAAQLQQVYDAP